MLSWAEFAPDFGRALVLLAVTIDDTPLDRAGPQLALPADQLRSPAHQRHRCDQGGRWLRRVDMRRGTE
jgi:hypothetical protein